MKKSHILAAAAVVVTTAIALTGCSSSSGGSGSSDSKIVIGSSNAISGAATFPEASQAAKAVFDQVNADGGINGHKIDYKILDDKGDAATSSANARQIVQSDNAVALVGSASLIDCQVNGAYYVQQKIVSIQGTGVDQACFKNANISPVNVGPFKDSELTLTYASKELGLKSICGFLEIAGGTEPSYKEAIESWTKNTGQKFTLLDDTVPYGASDYTPYVVKAKAAGCDGLFTNATQPDAIGTIKAAQAQGWNPTFLLLTSTYSDEFAKAVGPTGAKVYVPAEFAPYTDASDPATKDWRDLMTKDNIPLTSFAQGGYLAAKFFVEIAKGIKGDITRDSVAKAVRAHAAISNDMLANPWVFGNGSTHSSEHGGWPITLTADGAWKKAADDWLMLSE